ncbi:hypothetical protein KIPB_016186, partial [Kipferlia bialata]
IYIYIYVCVCVCVCVCVSNVPLKHGRVDTKAESASSGSERERLLRRPDQHDRAMYTSLANSPAPDDTSLSRQKTLYMRGILLGYVALVQHIARDFHV